MATLAGGIDIHKERCAVFMTHTGIDEPDEELQGFLDRFNKEFRRIPSTTEGVTRMVTSLREHEVWFLMENSTKTHDIYWILKGLGCNAIVAHSTDLFRITKSKGKNDDKDARELAGYMRRKLLGEVEFAESFIPSPDWMRRRELCRFLADNRNQLSVHKRQVRMHLLLHGQSTSKQYEDISCKAALDELLKMNDQVLSLHVASMKQLNKTADFTKKIIESEFMHNRMFEIIYSIPGFGLHSAAYLTSQIVDVSRYPDARNFSNSFGVRPRQSDSADSLKDMPISYRGDSLARRLAYQATFVHVTHVEDSFIKEKYRRLRSNGKPHKVAIVACTNSMLMLIYKLLVRNERYKDVSATTLASARVVADTMDLDRDHPVPEEVEDVSAA